MGVRKKRTENRCDLFVLDTQVCSSSETKDSEERWIELEFSSSVKYGSSALMISARSFESTRELNDLKSLTMVLRNPKIFQNVFSKSNQKNKCDSSSFDFAKCSSVSIPIIMRPKIVSKDLSSDLSLSRPRLPFEAAVFGFLC